jgi:GT2 family glycosyltransferase
MNAPSSNATIGAVIVAFNTGDDLIACVESLLAQDGGAPHVVVVDNGSSDDTIPKLRAWGAAQAARLGRPVLGDDPAEGPGRVILLDSGLNRGFAGGVNFGLAALTSVPGVRHFWVLNPDAWADTGAAAAILRAAAATPGYGLMGGRVCYAETPPRIQIDGGLVNMWTGVTGNANLGRTPDTAPLPNGAELDFITGANMVASRRFYETVGPMREDYFLYYEEADWAMRRGEMPLVVADGFLVWHRAGTAIGSPTLERLASPFSFWFKYRSRMKFILAFNPIGLPVAVAYATAKAAQLALKGAWPQVGALLRAVYGLPAPREVRERLSPEAARIAFGGAG